MNGPGQPTDLTEELTLLIRKRVLAGEKYKDIQAELEISPNTWDSWVWRDTQGFRQKLVQWKAERLVKKAEDLSDEILDTPHGEDSRILSIKQKEAEFVRETLGKEFYSKKSEVEQSGDIKIELVKFDTLP